jgi:hypothetical protein
VSVEEGALLVEDTDVAPVGVVVGVDVDDKADAVVETACLTRTRAPSTTTGLIKAIFRRAT